MHLLYPFGVRKKLPLAKESERTDGLIYLLCKSFGYVPLTPLGYAPKVHRGKEDGEAAPYPLRGINTAEQKKAKEPTVVTFGEPMVIRGDLIFDFRRRKQKQRILPSVLRCRKVSCFWVKYRR